MKRFILLSFVGFYLFFCSSSIVFARDRSSSGSFNTSSGNSGSFQSDISRGKGQGIRETNWQTERGVGSLDAQSNWNLENKTGTIDSTIVLPSGNTISGDKSINKNEDGGYSVQSTYTGQDGYTIDTEKNISKSEQGLVSEASLSGQPPLGSRLRGLDPQQTEIARNDLDVLRALAEIAHARHATISQLALAWILAHDEISSCIVGAATPEEVREDVGAADLQLSSDDIQQIENILQRPIEALVSGG